LKALILIGGEGTRLRPLTYKTLKCMVPIANRHFIEYQFELLKQSGIHEVVLSACYMPQKVKKAVGNGRKYGMKIDYAVEKTPLGTAGAIKNSEKFLDDTTVILNGDILTGIDIKLLVDFHRKSGAVATIALHEAKDPSAYGLVLAKEDGRVEKFLEKTGGKQAGGSWINAGIYIFGKEALGLIPAGRNVSVERETFPGIIEKTNKLFAHKQPEYWLDIGKIEQYKQANFDVLSGKFESPFGPEKSQGGIFAGEKTLIKEGAKFSPPVIIGKKGVIGRAVEITSSVIWDNVKIGDNAVIKDSIIGNKCVIGAGAVLNGAVLQDGSRVRGGTNHKSQIDRKSVV
jgi:NDP-sugar pyrophosphorylase family protein